MKKTIIALTGIMLAAGLVHAGLSTNEQGYVIDTNTNALGQVTVTYVGQFSPESSTVSPYTLTPDTNDGVLTVTGGGTYVIDPDETAGTVTNTLSAAHHGEVLRLVILPATNTFVIAEGTTAQLSGGTIAQTGAGTNDLVELWGVGTTWREADSSTLVE